MHPNTAYFLRSPDWNVTRHLLPTTTTTSLYTHSQKIKPPKQQQGKRKKTRPAQGLEWVKTKGMKNFQKNLQNGRSRPPKWKQKTKEEEKSSRSSERSTLSLCCLMPTPSLFHAYLFREWTRRYYFSSSNNNGKPNRSEKCIVHYRRLDSNSRKLG